MSIKDFGGQWAYVNLMAMRKGQNWRAEPELRPSDNLMDYATPMEMKHQRQIYLYFTIERFTVCYVSNNNQSEVFWGCV